MTLTVAGLSVIAEDVVRLRLVDHAGVTLPDFEAGAHVELSFAGFRRRYSLTSSPSDRSAYEVMVLRAWPGRGGSAFIHERLTVGDTLDVSEPVNGFALDRRARHHVFIGGGIGLTPFYTMTEALSSAGQTFDVHYVVRSQARALPTDAFDGHVSLHTGPGARRSLGLPTLLASLDATTAVYGCGPVSLLDDLRHVSRDLDWPAGRLRVETFGPGARPQDGTLSIRLSQSGTTLVAPPSASILERAARARRLRRRRLPPRRVWDVHRVGRGRRHRPSRRVPHTRAAPEPDVYLCLLVPHARRHSRLVEAAAEHSLDRSFQTLVWS